MRELALHKAMEQTDLSPLCASFDHVDSCASMCPKGQNITSNYMAPLVLCVLCWQHSYAIHRLAWTETRVIFFWWQLSL